MMVHKHPKVVSQRFKATQKTILSKMKWVNQKSVDDDVDDDHDDDIY